MTNSPTTHERLLSLDVMRGGTILAMILVNNPGSWNKIYAPLQHAQWHGWTPTDLIFPFFMFMVGVSMSYSYGKYDGIQRTKKSAMRRVVQRTITLILLGLLINAWGNVITPLFGAGEGFSFANLRWPGVLQRIGLAYFGASLIVLFCAPKLRFLVGAVMLFGYAALLLFTPTDVVSADRLSPTDNIVREVDLTLISAEHMYTGAISEPTDPEGLLSTLPSIVTILLGFGAGRLLRQDITILSKSLILFGIGAFMTLLGLSWNMLDPSLGGVPINKKLWTSSYVLLTGGLGAITLVVCLLFFDLLGAKSNFLRRLATAFQAVGVNAIFAFVASALGAWIFALAPYRSSTMKDCFYQTCCIGPFGDTELASLCYAITVVAFWWLILWGMWKRGWTIRV